MTYPLAGRLLCAVEGPVMAVCGVLVRPQFRAPNDRSAKVSARCKGWLGRHPLQPPRTAFWHLSLVLEPEGPSPGGSAFQR